MPPTPLRESPQVAVVLNDPRGVSNRIRSDAFLRKPGPLRKHNDGEENRMRRVTKRRTGLSASACLLGTATLLSTSSLWAQEEAEAPPEAAEAADPAEAAGEDAAPEEEAVESEAEESAPAAPPAASGDDSTAEDIEALKAQVAELQAKQEEAEMNALLADDNVDVEQETFRVYGFMDMGLQKNWANEASLISALFDTNALTFATGNINLYFDFNPDPDWRGLAEIRFTMAPLGEIESFGGIAGDFERVSTEQYDPHASVINAPMWGGYSVIERAWIEWKRFQQMRVRVGNFFTPFGIWNVDHGSPTLISIAMPQMVQQKFFPLRQTGLQFLGSTFKGDWELAYRAWLTNGRTEQNPLDFSDSKAFGGRLFARKDGGDLRAQFGASYHHGTVENKVVDITSAPPISETIEFNNDSTWAYTENIIGVDVSLDIGDTRIRSEGVARSKVYDEGKRQDVGISSPIPGGQEANAWSFASYLLVAHQLPWWGLEPYLYAEVLQQHWGLPDGLISPSVGLNIRFSPVAQFKFQASRGYFFDWLDDPPGETGINNVTTVVSRLVLAY